MGNLSKKDILELVITDDADGEEFEELLHVLLNNKVANSYHTDENITFGQKASDNIAKFVGSWRFICIFLGVLVLWMATNVVMMTHAFDPFPFILLNLVLSCVAAIQAPLIMMSQNRQEEKDRKRAVSDYQINLKSEIILKDIHEKLDTLLSNQVIILGKDGTIKEVIEEK